MDNDTSVKEKTPPTEEQKARRQAARMIGRIVWQENFRANHPDASGADVKAATEDAKDQFGKTGNKILKALEKSGLTVTGAPAGKAAKKA